MTPAFYGKQAFVLDHGLDECAINALEQTIVAELEKLQHETVAARTAKNGSAGPSAEVARKKARQEGYFGAPSEDALRV